MVALVVGQPVVKNKAGLQYSPDSQHVVDLYVWRVSRANDWEHNVLISFLSDAVRRFTTDPLNKVYGTLGFMGASGQSLIQADYALSLEEIYVIIARQFMLVSLHTKAHPVLNLLFRASTSRQSRQNLGKILPWTADWTKEPSETYILPFRRKCDWQLWVRWYVVLFIHPIFVFVLLTILLLVCSIQISLCA